MVFHTTAALGNLPRKEGATAVSCVCVLVCTTEHPLYAKKVGICAVAVSRGPAIANATATATATTTTTTAYDHADVNFQPPSQSGFRPEYVRSHLSLP
ncbi:hypothetical protein BDW71DRAFT_7158 [Aspergillus fruticulosus]